MVLCILIARHVCRAGIIMLLGNDIMSLDLCDISLHCMHHLIIIWYAHTSNLGKSRGRPFRV